MHAQNKPSLKHSIAWSVAGACGGITAGWLGRACSEMVDQSVLRTLAAPILAGVITGMLVEASGRVAGKRLVGSLFIPAVLGMIPGLMHDPTVGVIVFGVSAAALYGLLRQLVPNLYKLFNPEDARAGTQPDAGPATSVATDQTT